MGKVVKLEPVEIGSNYRFDPDEILEGAKGQEFTNLAILGTLPDGSIWVTGNSNAGEILVMMEMAKHQLLFSE
jgi:hypothetical protein